MAFNLSVKADALLQSIGIKPQIILDIEGVDIIFGAQPILKVLRWDDENAFWDTGLLWDSVIEDENSRDYIQLDGTTTNISQQINPDKGSSTSISTVNISLIDPNNEVSKLLSFDSINEILGRKAIFSIGLADGSYPEDTQPVFRGVVVDYYTEAGSVVISIAASDSLQKQTILEQVQTELALQIDNSQTTITVLDTNGFYLSQDALTSYVRIDDEIMQIASIDSDTQMTVVRAQLNTVANTHDAEATVDSFYRLQGSPLELALNIMLSNNNNEYFNSLDKPKSINFVSSTEFIDNALIFEYYNIQEKTGLTVGDYIQLNSTSNTGTYTIDEFGLLDNGGSYIIVNEPLTIEGEYTGDFLYKSKWNTLNFGLGMLTSEVDVEQFESIIASFGFNFVDYDLYIKETIDDAKEFIEKLYFAQGLYSIPRKARSSVKFIVPPLTSDVVPTLNVDAITNPNSIKQRRSIHKYLYNVFTYKYNIDSIEDKFLNVRSVISTDSIDRINVGKKQLKIEAGGLRNNPETNTLIENISQRMADRYKFAPVYFNGVNVSFKDGFAIEVGDIVPFGDRSLQVTDLQTGERGTNLQLFEVINKSLNVKDGKISLDLISTAFDINARYAVISLASKVGSGSTLTRIKIEKTNDTDEFADEYKKWIDFYGETIRIVSKDYTYDHETTLISVDPTDKSFLLVEALPAIPTTDCFVEVPVYDDSSKNVNAGYKLRFTHFNAQVKINSVTSAKIFEVDEPSKLQVGSFIYVHAKDFTRDSFEQKVKIDDITGSIVTLDKELNFTPQVDDLIENSNFGDGGFPYIII